MELLNNFDQLFRKLNEFQTLVFNNLTFSQSSMQNLHLSNPQENL
jgi:hypothetical protein